MKKSNLLIALTMLAGSIVLSPSTANAQDEKQAELERNWYDTCYIKKPIDEDKCYQLSKELAEKYPTSNYIKNAKGKVDAYEKGKAWEKAWARFETSLKAYEGAPDANKLEQLFSASEDVLKIQPDHQYVIGRMALAGANGALGQIYKNFDKVKRYGEQALKAFEPAKAPEGWQQSDWDTLREIVMAQINQYLGFQLIETKGDQEQALGYLAKAIQVRGKDVGWKDPNNYLLRSGVYSNQYIALRAEYDKLTNEEKIADAGKEILKKVSELLDTRLIPEYARVLATATKPGAKGIYDVVKPQFDQFWKYRTDAPDKAADYIKSYANDPTIAAVPIPVKAETTDNLNAPAAPTVSASNIKLAGPAAVAAGPGGKGAAANGKNGKNSKNSKAAPAKSSKSSTKKKRRG